MSDQQHRSFDADTQTATFPSPAELLVDHSHQGRLEVSATESEKLERIWRERPDLRERLAMNPSCSEHLFELLANDDLPVRCLVADNPSVPLSVLEVLAQDPSALVRTKVLANKRSSQAVVDALVDDSSPDVRAMAAANPCASESALDVLTEDHVSRVRAAVAANLNASASNLMTLAIDVDMRVRTNVSRNPGASEQARSAAHMLGTQWPPEETTYSEDVDRLGSLARDPSTRIEILELLIDVRDWWVRSGVAENPSTPLWLLERFFDEGRDTSDLCYVAPNPLVPQEMFERLANHSDRRVRAAAAKSPSASPALLTCLARDSEMWVRGSAADNHSTPPEVLWELARRSRGSEFESAMILGSLAKNPNSPADLLEYLAQENYAFVKEHVAVNPATPIHVLLALVEADSPSGIGGNIANRISGPPELFEHFAASLAPSTRGGLACNPNTPLSIVARLAKDAEAVVRKCVAMNELTTGDVLSTLEHDADSLVRRYVASHGNTRPEVLARLATDEDDVVRMSVAANTSTPLNSLYQLALDPDPHVRRYVLQNEAAGEDAHAVAAIMSAG